MSSVKAINIAGSFDIHLFSAARGGGITRFPRAAIIECSNRGTALRTAADNRDYDPELLSDNYLAVANHHRKLVEPIPCWRYDSLAADLNDTVMLDMERAFAIERRVARTESPYNTIYITGFVPETREMWLSCSEGGVPASRLEPSHFS